MEFQVSQDLKIDNLSSPRMKKSETKDSISSVDSGLSFDRSDLSDYEFVQKIDDSDVTSKERLKEQSKQMNESPESTELITNNDFVMPNNELADKICAQVEYYFSDDNIIKDAFLLKHVKKNKEGYVSLKLISSFKKVKHLSRDWRVIGAALTRSEKLELNSQGTKLRRVNPLPSHQTSRTILATGLPKLTIESVAEIFKFCGEIALIRVLKPGCPVPSEVRQTIAKRLEEWEECAMIEFTDSASARIATQMALGDVKIFELRHSVDKKKKKKKKKHQCTLDKTEIREDNSSSCGSEDGRLKRNFQGYQMYHIHNTPFQAGSSSSSSSSDMYLSRKLSSCSVSSSENMLRRLSSSSDSSRRYSTCSSGPETFYPNCWKNFYHENHRYSPGNSWMECPTHRRGSADSRRLFSTCDIRSLWNSEQNIFYRSSNVTRMPSGPDGTRGFGKNLLIKRK